MNADALSDLILALVCAYLGWSAGRQRAAWTGGMLILGIASTLGVLRFSEVPWALGPHKFMSVFSACVSFTLFAIALRWPFSPTSTRMAAAGRFIVLVGQRVGFGEGLAPVALNDPLHMAAFGDTVGRGEELPEAVCLHAKGFRQGKAFLVQCVDDFSNPGCDKRVLRQLGRVLHRLDIQYRGGNVVDRVAVSEAHRKRVGAVHVAIPEVRAESRQCLLAGGMRNGGQWHGLLDGADEDLGRAAQAAGIEAGRRFRDQAGTALSQREMPRQLKGAS